MVLQRIYLNQDCQAKGLSSIEIKPSKGGYFAKKNERLFCA